MMAPPPDLDDARGERGDELAVVRDEDQRAGVLLQRGVERLDGFHVEVVGRLVHQQHVGLLQDQLAEQHAALLAAGDDLDRLLRRRRRRTAAGRACRARSARRRPRACPAGRSSRPASCPSAKSAAWSWAK